MGTPSPAGGAKQQGGARPADRVIPFGKYLLLDRISVGGMAEVFRAKSFGIEGFEKVLAIKRILPTMAEDQDFIEMFIDEAKIAGHLNHANICPIYELGKLGDSHYIAMEYVWGKDLLQIMNRFRKMRKAMPPAMVAWAAAKVCEGLDYAHKKKDRAGNAMGIIHRDMSPQNVLVSYEGQVKIIDFGIAKAASRNTKTQAGVLKGKFGYMSPEQVRGLPIDPRSDLFAVGTCMHEMATSERLFLGESDFHTLEKVRNAEVLPPTKYVPDFPKELEEIIMRALTVEVDDRWQSAAEMQEALTRFLAAQRPPYGTSKLAAWMKTAFAAEMATEKERMLAYQDVGKGALTPSQPPPPPKGVRKPTTQGMAAPPPPGPRVTAPLPAPKPAGQGTEELDLAPYATADDDEPDDLAGEATVVGASPFDDDEPPQRRGSVPELPEQPTQIFFSADELEEEPPPPRSPAVSGAQPETVVVAPAPMQVGGPARRTAPPSSSVATPAAFAPTVVPPQPYAPQQPAFAQPPPGASASPYTAASTTGAAMPIGGRVQAQSELRGPPPGTPTTGVQAPGSGGAGRMLLLAVAAVLLLAVGAGGAFLVLGGEKSGTVEIHTVPQVPAQVLLDNVPRGVAPLRLEHVPAGDRLVAIQVEGQPPQIRHVQVTPGSTAVLEIAVVPSMYAMAQGPGPFAPGAAMPPGPLGAYPPTPTAPTPIVPTPMAPTPMAPTPMAPTPMAPTPIVPTPIVPTPIVPTPIVPTPTAPTPIVPTPTHAAPTPTHAAPTPAPTPIHAAPTPTPIHAAPTPTPIHAAPTPTPTHAAPTPTPVHVAPTPTHAAPTPTPTHAVPTPTHVAPTPTHVAASEGDEGGSRAHGSGDLVINTMPWARVFVDGHDTGRNTPIPSYRVRAGHHTLGLRTPDNQMHEVEVDVPAGETVRIIRRL